MSDDDLSRPEFWNQRYLEKSTGWDKGRAAPPIARMLREPVLPAGSRVVVLGAGRGHEALESARAGLRVTAVDFAEEAVKHLRSAAEAAGLPIEVLQEDVFELGRRHPAAFDAALEHTCFCAIDPVRREEYVRAVVDALAPGGVFFGLFYAHGRPGGPPITTSREEVERLFASHFALERLVTPPDSFAGRAGEELEFVFRRR